MAFSFILFVFRLDLQTHSCRLPVADFKLQTLTYRFSVADFGLQTLTCRLLVADFQLQASSCRLSAADCQSHVAQANMKDSGTLLALVKVLKANEVVIDSKDFGLPTVDFIEKHEEFLQDAVVAVGKFKISDLSTACQQVCTDVSREEAERFSMICSQCVPCLQILCI